MSEGDKQLAGGSTEVALVEGGQPQKSVDAVKIVPGLLTRTLEATRAEIEREDAEYVEGLRLYQAEEPKARAAFVEAMEQYEAVVSRCRVEQDAFLRQYLDSEKTPEGKIAQFNYDVVKYLVEHKSEVVQCLRSLPSSATYEQILEAVLKNLIFRNVRIEFQTYEESYHFASTYLGEFLHKIITEGFQTPHGVSILIDDKKDRRAYTGVYNFPISPNGGEVLEFLFTFKTEAEFNFQDNGKWKYFDSIIDTLSFWFRYRTCLGSRKKLFDHILDNGFYDFCKRNLIKDYKSAQGAVDLSTDEARSRVVNDLISCFLDSSLGLPDFPRKPNLDDFLKVRPVAPSCAVPGFPKFERTPRLREQLRVHLIRLGIADQADRVCAEVAEHTRQESEQGWADNVIQNWDAKGRISKYLAKRRFGRLNEVEEEVKGLYALLRIINLLISQGTIYFQVGETSAQHSQGRLFLKAAEYLIRLSRVIAVEIEAMLDSQGKEVGLPATTGDLLVSLTNQNGNATRVVETLQAMNAELTANEELFPFRVEDGK